MKRGLTYFCLLTLTAAGLTFGAGGIAVIDMEVLIRSHPNTSGDKKLLKETVKEYEAERDVQRKRVEKLEGAYETAVREVQNPALSEKARERMTETAREAGAELQEAGRKLKETMQSLQRSLTEQEVRMLKRTLGEIQTVIEEYAKEKGYTTVLDSSARRMGQVPTVIYFDNSIDITDAILKKMGVTAVPPEELE